MTDTRIEPGSRLQAPATEVHTPQGRKLPEVLAPVWSERKRILLWSAGIGVVTLLFNFLVLNLTYKTSTILLPETEKGKLGALSQFSGLAQLAGVSVPGSEVSRLYPIILTSETILIPVIERTYQTLRYKEPVNLITFLDIDEGSPQKDMEKTLKELRGLLTTSFDTKTSTVVVTLEMEEQQLVADVLNAIISEVDGYMRLKRINTASEQVRWISTRLLEVEKELRVAEEEFRRFTERNRRVQDSPELMLHQQRLLREVTVKSTITIELKKQYELSKIEEIKNISIVNVLDPARPPARKERPKRATNAALAFLFTFAGMGAWFAMKPVWGEKVTEFWQNVTAKEKESRKKEEG